jgi:hypothetical protein
MTREEMIAELEEWQREEDEAARLAASAKFVEEDPERNISVKTPVQ